MADSDVEVIEDPQTGFYMELDPAGSAKYVPEDDEDETPALSADDVGIDAEDAKRASKALDAGTAARVDANKPAGAANALLFHQWDGDKKD